MRRQDPLSLVKAAELADLRRQARSARWRQRLARWEATLRAWERHGKRLAVVGSVLSGLATGVARLHRYIDARRVPAAELPAPSGGASTALDRVPEPTPPKP